MKGLFGHLAWCVLAVVIAGGSTEVRAYSYVMMSDERLLEEAEGVARVRVERILPTIDGDLETRYALRVLQTLVGMPLATTEVLALPGNTRAPNRRFSTPGVPQIRRGDVLLLFQHRRDDGVLQATELSLGLFKQTRGAGGLVYTRDLQASREFGDRARMQPFHAPRDVAAFESWLRARGRGERWSADYFRSEAVLESAVATEVDVLSEPAHEASLLPAPLKPELAWSVAARPEHEAMRQGGEALTQTVAFWNSLAIRPALRYVEPKLADEGCGMAMSGAIDGLVCLDDTDGLIGGRFIDGGTLAVSGVLETSQAGIRAAAPRQSVVILRAGSEGFLRGDQGVEWLAHELAEAIGLDPACAGPDTRSCAASAAASGSAPGAATSLPDEMPESPKADAPQAGAPTHLTAFADGTTALLQWQHPEDRTGVLFYRFEQCQGAGCTDFLPNLTTTTGNQFDQPALTPSTPYRFRVLAVGATGFSDSGYSNIAEVTAGSATPVILALGSGVPVPDLSGPPRARLRYALEVPTGATDLQFSLAGGSGDADLFIRLGSSPTAAENDCNSRASGNDERCAVALPAAGTWFALVEGFSAFAGLTLSASYQGGGSPPPPPPACSGDCIFRGDFE